MSLLHTRKVSSSEPGALLFLGNYNGTLAAARCLGRQGINVALVDSSSWSRAGGSRYVAHFERCPPIDDAEKLVAWLIDKGRTSGRSRAAARLGGRVLFPASDEQAFVFAKYARELAWYYRLHQPSVQSIYRLLNKQRLYEACSLLGIAYPRTWFPRGQSELRDLLPEMGMEVMIKPKTQIQLMTQSKGAEVSAVEGIEGSYVRFMRENRYGRSIIDYDNDVVWPMVQAYHRSEQPRIYSVAGFMDFARSTPLVRASIKVLQRPRKMGVGVCFEAADVDACMVQRIGDLCRHMQYQGIFEVEFIEHAGEMLLIDFNPRGYGQMGFEIARGLPLPLLHYLKASGDEVRFAKVARLAADWQPRGREAYCHGLFLSLVDLVQGTSELLTGAKSEGWRRWMRARGEALTDAVRAPNDPIPTLLDILNHGLEFLRHPRSFVRSLSR